MLLEVRIHHLHSLTVYFLVSKLRHTGHSLVLHLDFFFGKALNKNSGVAFGTQNSSIEKGIWCGTETMFVQQLGGGFKHFLFLLLPEEMIQFDEHQHIFKWVVQPPTRPGIRWLFLGSTVKKRANFHQGPSVERPWQRLGTSLTQLYSCTS